MKSKIYKTLATYVADHGVDPVMIAERVNSQLDCEGSTSPAVVQALLDECLSREDQVRYGLKVQQSCVPSEMYFDSATGEFVITSDGKKMAAIYDRQRGWGIVDYEAHELSEAQLDFLCMTLKDVASECADAQKWVEKHSMAEAA